MHSTRVYKIDIVPVTSTPLPSVAFDLSFAVTCCGDETRAKRCVERLLAIAIGLEVTNAEPAIDGTRWMVDIKLGPNSPAKRAEIEIARWFDDSSAAVDKRDATRSLFMIVETAIMT